MKNSVFTIALFSAILFCSSFQYVKPDESILIGSWKVETFTKGVEDINISSLEIQLQCSVEGELGQLSGKIQKDLFSAIYEITSKKGIKISPIMSTNLGQSDLSKKFISSFQEVDHYVIHQNDLELINKELGVRITLRKEP